MKPEDIARKIIKEQSLIIGEQLARQMAKDSGVVEFNSSKIEDLTITSSDSGTAIDSLINSYRKLFGQASVEVCFDVIRKISGTDTQSLFSDNLQAKLTGSR